LPDVCENIGLAGSAVAQETVRVGTEVVGAVIPVVVVVDTGLLEGGVVDECRDGEHALTVTTAHNGMIRGIAI